MKSSPKTNLAIRLLPYNKKRNRVTSNLRGHPIFLNDYCLLPSKEFVVLHHLINLGSNLGDVLLAFVVAQDAIN